MRLACLAASLGLVACHSSDRDPPGACTLEARPAVSVTLMSAGSGQPVTGATAVLFEGAFTETMAEPVPGLYSGALERQGTYDLTITAAGFQRHTTTGIVVTHDGCHVRTQELKIALTSTEGSLAWLLIRFDGQGHSIDLVRGLGVDR